MAILLALVAACSWGASDFLGGFAGRRSGDDRIVAITLASQAVGVPIMLAVAPLGGTALVLDRSAGAAAAAGAVGALAVGFLYRGLAAGRMGLVSPVAGAIGASVPVLVGVLRGERPSGLAWAGVAVALVAIVLVSREVPDSPALLAAQRRAWSAPPGLRDGLLAGIGFGLFFVLLDLAGESGGLWQLAFVRLGGVTSFAVVGAFARQPLRPVAGTWVPIVAIGVLDLAANGAYLLATRVGLLALVVVVSSLYPVGTVLLARGVLGERLERHQLIGLALAVAAVATIGVG